MHGTKFNNTVLNTVFSDIKKLTMSSKKKERTLIFFSRCPGEKRKSCIK